VRNLTASLKVGFLKFAVACVVAAAPRTAAAALSLEIGPVLPFPGRQSADLVFTETAPIENEGLFAYDLLITGPVAARDLIRLDGVAAGNFPGFVLGDDPSKYTFSVAESDANHVLVNVSSNNDLFDIMSGKRAARAFYLLTPAGLVQSALGWCGETALAFDPGATVFGSGDPNRPDVNIPVDLRDGAVLCPEPTGPALLGMAGLLALRRRRGPRAHQSAERI
jgi:hypothetical protein